MSVKNKSCCTLSRSSISNFTAIQDNKLKPVSEQVCRDGDMVLIQGGNFLMGTIDQDGYPEDGEGPVRIETVQSFLIDRYAVSNREFSEFVKSTGYVTDAEKYGWSFVFYLLLPKKEQKKAHRYPENTPWWKAVRGAYWRRPEGKGSDIYQRMNHPVVHISWLDAMAYCQWAGKELPTEIQWEYAARGGLVQKRFPWGDELEPNGEHLCNIWQGTFPHNNTREDGFLGTAPVDSFPPNGYGLFNVVGNVWEWCRNSFETNTENSKTMRGGSYLCHESYCNRYRVGARTSNILDSSSGNLGFRCVKRL